jgi:RimJ/RimL family protein N-acetyltransferase
MRFLEGATCLPTIEFDGWRFRPVRAEDAQDLFTVFGDEVVCRYWSRPALTDLAQAQLLAAEIEELFQRRELFQWALVRADEDRLVGTGTLASLESVHRRAEVGFALARSEWGGGVMRRAVKELVRFGLDVLDLHRIEAEVDPRNEASIRILEGNGFKREGYRREAYFHNNEIQDSASYALLEREFPN